MGIIGKFRAPIFNGQDPWDPMAMPTKWSGGFYSPYAKYYKGCAPLEVLHLDWKKPRRVFMRRQWACKFAKGKHIVIHYSKKGSTTPEQNETKWCARFIYNSDSITKNIYTIHISMRIIFMELPLPSNAKWIQNYLPVKIFFPSNLVQEEGTNTSVSQWRKRRRRKLHSSSYKPLSSHLRNHTCFLCSSFCNDLQNDLSLCVSLCAIVYVYVCLSLDGQSFVCEINIWFLNLIYKNWASKLSAFGD